MSINLETFNSGALPCNEVGDFRLWHFSDLTLLFSGCLFVEVKQTSLSRWQSSDVSLRATKVTLAPTDDGALRAN